jgi:hypothetical protein
LATFKYDQGALGENLAGAQLAAVMNGEFVRETMRGEGIGALDLQLKYPVTFPVATHHQLAVQVKTGSSFATWTPSKNRWRLGNIDKGHVEKWRGTNQPVLLLWVRLDPRVSVYWKLIGSTTPINPLSLSDSHRLTPSARFEIERLVQIYRMDRHSLSPITVSDASSTSEIRKWSARRFAKIRGLTPSPLGLVSISNYAWRHLTRVTRTQSHIIDSLTVLPYVRELLKIRPHQLQTISETSTLCAGSTLVSRKVLAIYRDVRFSDKGPCAVYVRLDEKISYPTMWQETGLIRSKVQQELRLESVYRKPA